MPVSKMDVSGNFSLENLIWPKSRIVSSDGPKYVLQLAATGHKTPPYPFDSQVNYNRDFYAAVTVTLCNTHSEQEALVSLYLTQYNGASYEFPYGNPSFFAIKANAIEYKFRLPIKATLIRRGLLVPTRGVLVAETDTDGISVTCSGIVGMVKTAYFDII